MDKILSIFTSYWANPLLKDLDAIYIGISRSVPRWSVPFEYRHLPLLAPSRETFAIEDEGKFAAAYRKQLMKLGAERIVTAFMNVSSRHGGRPVVLLCYESPGQFCHRRIFADWLFEQASVEVLELLPETISRVGLPGKQPPLF
jgi:hypothetical protein